jgi:4a-hydroxytetrahydrobiopterin dehydratase
MVQAMTLAAETCVPCRGTVPALTAAEAEVLQTELDARWKVVDGHRLVAEYSFSDFASALTFTNQVGAVAEAEGHHPDIDLGWGRVRLTIWTHTVGGLTRSDFVLAAKIDGLG